MVRRVSRTLVKRSCHLICVEEPEYEAWRGHWVVSGGPMPGDCRPRTPPHKNVAPKGISGDAADVEQLIFISRRTNSYSFPQTRTILDLREAAYSNRMRSGQASSDAVLTKERAKTNTTTNALHISLECNYATALLWMCLRPILISTHKLCCVGTTSRDDSKVRCLRKRWASARIGATAQLRNCELPTLLMRLLTGPITTRENALHASCSFSGVQSQEHAITVDFDLQRMQAWGRLMSSTDFAR